MFHLLVLFVFYLPYTNVLNVLPFISIEANEFEIHLFFIFFKKYLTLTLGHSLALQTGNSATMKSKFSVKQLAKLAGISVRTLHLYDQIGLLKPFHRTEAGYREYGAAELLRLQQILFYKELDFPLKEICDILDDPDFDLIRALEGHKTALANRRDRLDTLLNTIDKTIIHLKNKTMFNFEELYEGLTKEQAAARRNEAIEKWGEDAIVRSEQALLKKTALDLEKLKAGQKDIIEKLQLLVKEDPASEKVQEQIARHYLNIRGFWGIADGEDLQACAYAGLGDLFLSDDRYTSKNGKPDPQYTIFMRDAMHIYANAHLV